MQVNFIDQKIVSSYHSLENYKFLKCTFGKSKRLCQSSWFKTYKLLHYVKKNNAVICFSWASREFGCNLCFKTKKDPEFISKGHSNWQKAEEQFEDDQKSNCHRTAV